jgi:[histone H3]-N6,N6-dimethyl-lysine9 N-methyltransferase
MTLRWWEIITLFTNVWIIRYLIFFDDGCTQYVPHDSVRLVVKRGPLIWDDCHLDIREFIRSYLDLYPENPMVRLAVNQKVKTEWNSKLRYG